MVRKKKKLTKKQQEMRKKVIGVLSAFLIIFILGYAVGKNGVNKEKWQSALSRLETSFREFGEGNKRTESIQSGSAIIRVLDVGQGSATLLQSEDGTNILIDSGRDDDKQKKIMQYLDKYIGTGGTIDLLIFTHNHADHLGFGDQILSYYKVKEVWMNGLDATTKVYERVLDAVATSDARYKEPRSGEKASVGPFELRVLNPGEEEITDQNDRSIAVKVDVNQVSVMVTGDAGTPVEKKIMEQNTSLRSTILLLGHHGSKYSSSKEWLRTIQPEVAIYSAGEGNVYGHPNQETMNRVRGLEIPFYGTDINGTLTILVDQEGTYQIQPEKGGEGNENGVGRN